MNAKIRKREINLTTLGSGVILVGLWIFLKLALTFLIHGNEIEEEFPPVVIFWANVILWIIAALILLMSLYIGLSARAEGKGKKKTIVYLILSGVMACFALIIVIFDGYLLFVPTSDIFNVIVTLIIDATVLVMLVELIVNAVGVRRLRKEEAKA